MSCAERQDEIALYAGGDLPEAETVRIERHLAECSECAELATLLAADRELLRARPPEVTEMDFDAMRRELRRSIVRGRRVWRWAPVAAVAAALVLAIAIPSRTDRRVVRSVSAVEAKTAMAARTTAAVPQAQPVPAAKRTSGKRRPSVLRSDVEMRLNTADPSVTIILLPVKVENPNE